MVEAHRAPAAHILVFEPRVEGHHPGNLRVVTEELLAAGYRLTLAVDRAPEAFALTESELGNTLERVTIVAAYAQAADRKHKLRRIAGLAEAAAADFVFLPSLDEIGSAMMRRAAFGLLPPAALHGRLGGIYFRPRFLASLGWSLNQRLKAIGFQRLLRGGWFSQLLLPDPYLAAALKARAPQAPAFFCPDFFPADFAADRANARDAFDLPEDRRVFLFYGAGYKRKGLDLAVQAMLSLDDETPAFLLCAGRHKADAKVVTGLTQLMQQGRARVLDHYISNEEEKRLFAASDVVLLPYRHHFGGSGVLVRAMGAGMPVIVSDEQLIGRLTREHGLGLLFRPGDADALRAAIARAAVAAPEELARWQQAARQAAPNWSRQTFRDVLLDSFARAIKAQAVGHRGAAQP